LAVLNVVADENTLAERVAARFVDVVRDAVRARGVALVCLTGGATARKPYEALASDPWRTRVEWDHVQVYWGDERHVPPDHKDSNYGMARDALLMHVPIPAANVHRIRGELPPDEAARQYERGLPDRFDLLLLGVGEDAHIASIFPRTPVVNEQQRRVCAVWAAHLKAYRITLTPTALLSGAHIVVIVASAAKAPAVAAALEKTPDPVQYPVHLLRAADDRVEWFIDRAAARGLTSRHG
jgi:6-phosphogluconolactonase